MAVEPSTWSGWFSSGLLAGVLVAGVALFRRRKEEATDPSPAVGPKRSFFRRSATAPPLNPSISGARADVPEYYEGPPEPPVARRAARASSASPDAPVHDLDAVLAQLDRLSEQIRRRPGSRGVRGPPPSSPPPGPPTS